MVFLGFFHLGLESRNFLVTFLGDCIYVFLSFGVQAAFGEVRFLSGSFGELLGSRRISIFKSSLQVFLLASYALRIGVARCRQRWMRCAHFSSRSNLHFSIEFARFVLQLKCKATTSMSSAMSEASWVLIAFSYALRYRERASFMGSPFTA